MCIARIDDGKLFQYHRSKLKSRQSMRNEHNSFEEALSTKESAAERPQDEVREFTKEYSPKWRQDTARQVRELRRDYQEKKRAAAAENEMRAEQRLLLDAEIADLEHNADFYREQLVRLDEQIENQKSRVWFRVKSLFGFDPKELPEETEFQEQVTALRKILQEAAGKRQLLQDMEDVILDDAELIAAKEEIAKFYEEQGGLKDDFEREQERGLRSVHEVSKNRQVLFLHGLPSGGLEANTEQNNPNIATSAMTFLDRAKTLVGLEPTISASTKHLSEAGVSQEHSITAGRQRFGGEGRIYERPVLYKAGFILGEGKIVSAYGGDAATTAENTKRRFSKYDRSLRSAVQGDFAERLEDALEHKVEEKSGIAESAINELVIEKPSITGAYAYIDMPDDFESWGGNGQEKTQETYRQYREEITEQQMGTILSSLELSKEFGLPAYGVREDGGILDLLGEDIQSVSPEQVTKREFSFSAEERIGYVENAMGFARDETLQSDARAKLAEIQSLGGSHDNDPGLATRLENKEKAARMLRILDERNDDLFDYIRIEARDNGLLDVSPDEFLRRERETGSSEETLQILGEALTGSDSIQGAISSFQETKLLRENLKQRIFRPKEELSEERLTDAPYEKGRPSENAL